ncbi:MAG: trypsin-like peptidase domain-containing protein [Acidobacteria bacterium]|nr:trypsin-like peptidase domain-containing protein [Acidobacteriota bacterium]
MKRGICLLVLCVFALPSLAPAGAAAAEDPLASVLKREGYTVSLDLKVRKKKRDSLERVVSDLLGDNGPNAYATGFVVGDGLVMTAYHVVSGGLSADKRRQLGFSMDDQLEVEASVKGCIAKVLKIDTDADLALLGVCGSTKPHGTLAFQPALSQDEELLVIARPNGNKAVRRGGFKGTYIYRGREYWSAKIEGRDGFSGSPVYNEKGELVGVFSGYDYARKVALISPGAHAQKLLQDYTEHIKK